MELTIHEEGKFRYMEQGEGEVLLLLHGLFGALSNFEHIAQEFSTKYRVIIPMLPLFELPLRELTVQALKEHIYEFVQHKKITKMHLLGNSLGGHVALVFTIDHPEMVKSLILTGSSGLYENTFGSSFPPRQNYEFIKQRAEETFFSPEMATKELVDEVYDTVNDREKCLRIVAAAKSAMRHNLAEQLKQIEVPTLLIWGKQDVITPPFVGAEFNQGIKNSTLHYLDECGHAPMMEKPQDFNRLLREFLNQQA
jgi:pimeloyl-ACP methyl ester carboxylesterase